MSATTMLSQTRAGLRHQGSLFNARTASRERINMARRERHTPVVLGELKLTC